MRFSLILAVTMIAALAMVGAAPLQADNNRRTVTVRTSKPLKSVRTVRTVRPIRPNRPVQRVEVTNPKVDLTVNPKQKLPKVVRPDGKKPLSVGFKKTSKSAVVAKDTRTSTEIDVTKGSKQLPTVSKLLPPFTSLIEPLADTV